MYGEQIHCNGNGLTNKTERVTEKTKACKNKHSNPWNRGISVQKYRSQTYYDNGHNQHENMYVTRKPRNNIV
ncbi:hypothetical protein SDC9_178403 [bioreactor metagenome]|uniref:Uncharacterized protein n=1 Tax=bioreactor metagenome TaxID=1076179 RepID=A0A645GY02_9ZZZZ